MAYDIYGNNLRRGYCEVHPNVHEEYPCSLCYAETRRDNRQQEDPRQQDYEAQHLIDDLQSQKERLLSALKEFVHVRHIDQELIDRAKQLINEIEKQ